MWTRIWLPARPERTVFEGPAATRCGPLAVRVCAVSNRCRRGAPARGRVPGWGRCHRRARKPGWSRTRAPVQFRTRVPVQCRTRVPVRAGHRTRCPACRWCCTGAARRSRVGRLAVEPLPTAGYGRGAIAGPRLALEGVRHPVLRAVHAGVVRHLANGILARCMHEKCVHDAHRNEEQHHDDDHDEADNATAVALLGASVDRRGGRGERTNGGHACGRGR